MLEQGDKAVQRMHLDQVGTVEQLRGMDLEDTQGFEAEVGTCWVPQEGRLVLEGTPAELEGWRACLELEVQLVHWDHMVEMLVEVVEEDKLAPD